MHALAVVALGALCTWAAVSVILDARAPVIVRGTCAVAMFVAGLPFLVGAARALGVVSRRRDPDIVEIAYAATLLVLVSLAAAWSVRRQAVQHRGLGAPVTAGALVAFGVGLSYDDDRYYGWFVVGAWCVIGWVLAELATPRTRIVIAADARAIRGADPTRCR